jgi:DNA repair protein RecN (Recombination protein N)
MLYELRIENFAIIERLELNFSDKLITFTGETGAGKSIIIDAVEAVLGGRVDATMIRSGTERANVEAVFRIPQAVRAPLRALLEREGLLEDAENGDERGDERGGERGDELVLGREIRHTGRSVARANGRSVNVGLLGELAAYLVDVHGQSEHLSLLRVSQHIGLLDRFANIESDLDAYRHTYHALQKVRHELAELRAAESEAARRTDILTYQINEIEAARLRADEEDSLRQERNRLANAEGLASAAQEALQALDEGSPEAPSVTDLFGQVAHNLHTLARLDTAQAALSEQADTLFEGITDLSRTLRDYFENIEFNPKRLNQVEERLNLFHTLKRKYGATLADVLAFAENARQQLDAITHAAERIGELEADEGRLLETLGKQGITLSEKRHKAAAKLAKAIEAELQELHMAAARFQVQFTEKPDPNGAPVENGKRVAFDANGIEHIEFLVAPNPGEGFKPLVKVASGGETARLMLAIKDVLAQADPVPTLIFDEIDQGIGGRVGTVVGRKLHKLARRHQVLCITHLPQLAAFGDQHYRVQKEVEAGRTITHVQRLDGERRILELAQMMGDVSDGTRQSAQELLELAAKAK